jgi:hypothetical protein
LGKFGHPLGRTGCGMFAFWSDTNSTTLLERTGCTCRKKMFAHGILTRKGKCFVHHNEKKGKALFRPPLRMCINANQFGATRIHARVHDSVQAKNPSRKAPTSLQ